MRTAANPMILDRLCSVAAQAQAHDPIATSQPLEAVLFVETATPWGEHFYDADAEGAIPQRIAAAQREYFERRSAAGLPFAADLGARRTYAIAPDADRSDGGGRRVVLATRPPGPIASYALTEYRFDDEDPAVVGLVESCLLGPQDLGAFDAWATGRALPRQFFICTHGQVDICCARFGVPLYRALRATPAVEAWRTSHFGGHRFAPTVMEFPAGYTWAFVDAGATRHIVDRDEPIGALAKNIRGWSGVRLHVQPLDREALLRHGWDWLNYARTGEVVEAKPELGRWTVRLAATSSSGTTVRYEGVVVARREVAISGCGALPGAATKPLPELQLESSNVW
jgi:hypothetical protein